MTRRPFLVGVFLGVLWAGVFAGAQDPPGETVNPNLPDSSQRDARKIVRLSLGETIRIALGHNIDLQLERIAYFRSAKDVQVARAAFDPVFATNYTMNKFRQPTVDFLSGVAPTTEVNVNPFTFQNFDFGISGLLPTGTTYNVTAENSRADNPESGFFSFNPRNETSISGTVTQPLLKNFGFDANLADLRISQNNEAKAERGLLRLHQDTIASVENAYWELVFAYKDLDVKEKGVMEAQTLLEINRHKVAVGSAKRIDIVDAEANIETQKSGIIDAVNALEGAQDTLLDLINYQEILRERGEVDQYAPFFEHIWVIPTTELDFRPYSIDLNDAVQRAMDSREDLQQARLDVENGRLELLRRENQLLPVLNLSGTWTPRGLEENVGNSLDELGSGRFYDWTVAINLEYPIGNRLEKNRYYQAEADLETSRLALVKLENQVILEVTQLVRAVDAAYQLVITNQKVVRLRREQFEAEQQRLRVGNSTAYQVELVQNDLLEAESQLIRSQVDYKRAIAAYENSVSIIYDKLVESE